MTVTSNLYLNLAAWQQNHAYNVGDRISNDTAPPKAYQCITAGTSQNVAGQGPKGPASDITDGTAHFKYMTAIDYTSLGTWWSGIASTLTDNVVASVWHCGTPVTIGYPYQSYLTTTTKTVGSYTITIQAAPGDSYRDKGGGNAAPLAVRTDCLLFQMPSGIGYTNYFSIQCPNVIFDGIQFQDPYSNSQSTIFYLQSGATGAIIRGCLFDGYSQSSVSADMLDLDANGWKMYNTTIIDRSVGSAGGYTAKTSGTVTFNAANCTFVSTGGNTTGTAFLTNASGATGSLKNIVFTGYTVPVGNGGTGTVTLTNCATNVTNSFIRSVIVDGGNCKYSIATGSLYNSITTDFRLKVGSPLIGGGVVDTTDVPTGDDAFHNIRVSPWDIGADEYIPQSVVSLPTLRCTATAVRSVSASATANLPTLRCAATIAAVVTATCTVSVPSLRCSAAAQQVVSATSTVQVPTLRAVVAAVQSNQTTGVGSLTSMSCTASAGQSDLISAHARVTGLSAVGAAGQSNLISALTYTSGVGCVVTAGHALVATATASLPTLRCVAAAAVQNRASAAVTLTALSATASITLVYGGTATVNVPTLRCASVARQENFASGTATLTSMKAVGIGPNYAYGGGTISIAAVAAGSIPVAASAIVPFGALTAAATGIQENFVSGSGTITVSSATNVNPSHGSGTISGLQAVVRVQQENNTRCATYVSGIAAIVQATQVYGVTAVNTLTISASGVGLMEGGSFAITAAINVPTLRCVAIFGEQALSTATGTIVIKAVGVARQERSVTVLAQVPTLTASVVAGEEARATAAISIPTLRASVVAGQSNQFTAVVTVPTLRAAVVAGQEAVATVQSTLAIGAAAQAGQSALTNASATIYSPSGLVAAGQENFVSCATVLMKVAASVQVGQGNACQGTGTISIAAVVQGTNPIGAAASTTLMAMSAQGVFGQEVLASCTTLLTSVYDYARAALEQAATGLTTLTTLTASVQAAMSTTVHATATLTSIQASGVAYRGWVGTAVAQLPSLSAAATAQQVYAASSTSTLTTVTANVQAGAEDVAHGSGTISLSASGIMYTGTLIHAAVNLPTLRCVASASLTNGVTGASTIVLTAAARAYMETFSSAIATLQLSARGAVYPVPPIVDAEEVIYVDSDDRVVYVTE